MFKHRAFSRSFTSDRGRQAQANHYVYSTIDDVATVSAAGYFDRVKSTLKKGDLISASVFVDGTPSKLDLVVADVPLIGSVTVSLGGGGRVPGARFMAAATRVHPPITSHTASATQLFSVSDVHFVTPDYLVPRLRFGFVAWFTATSSEGDTGNALTLAGASLQKDVAWSRIKALDGSTSAVIPSGGNA